MRKATGVPRRPVVLIILDGFGVNPSRVNNAVAAADTPKFDAYFSRHSHTLLQASGRAVGLPDGQMGNSEVGHLTLGSGGVVRQDLVHIDDCISDGSFYENTALKRAADAACANNRPLHLIGLVSDGGVHSHLRHLLALLELCRRRGAKPLLHLITDGRDTPPRSILNLLPTVEAALETSDGAIATISGRYFAMDRDNRWDRTEAAWRAMVRKDGNRAPSPREAIIAAYEADENDEFIKPTVLPTAEPIVAGDRAVFFNFRKDRTRQLTAALFRGDFAHFDRGHYEPISVTCFTQYDSWYGLPYAFEQERPRTTLAEIISKAGLKQFHCAETEKYPHVTYFFNGGQGEAFSGEDRVIIPSPKVATYDLAPDMSAAAVADAVIDAIKSHQYAFLVVNFANGDMVGHTAVPHAVIKAVEALDREAGRVMDCAVAEGCSVLLTADHGNCDEMVDPITGEPHTQHTVYPVPCLIVDETAWQLGTGGGLSNVAPTVLHLMGLKIPDTMQGQTLLLKPLRSSSMSQ